MPEDNHDHDIVSLYISFALILAGVILIATWSSTANPKTMLGLGFGLFGTGFGFWLNSQVFK